MLKQLICAIRFVAEQLGATVDWDAKNSTVIIKGNDVDIK